MWRWAAGFLVAAVASLGLVPAAVAQGAAGETVDIEGLAGTMLRPAGATAGVIIIAGSGPTDRNGNSKAGLKTDAYKQLGDALAKAGIASLRFDKRGVGESLKDKAGAALTEDKITVESSAADVATLVAWMAKQPGIARVVLAGHSEGGLVALVTAKSTKVDRVVVMAASGQPLGALLRKQFARQPIPEPIAEEIERVLAALETGKETGPMKPPVDQLFRFSLQPFLRSVLTLDPVPLIKEVTVPILVVGGGADMQVGRFDYEPLVAARSGVIGHWEARMSHVLKEAIDDGESQAKAYTDPAVPLVPGLVEAVVKFVKGM